jgi:hypothetical protein
MPRLAPVTSQEAMAKRGRWGVPGCQGRGGDGGPGCCA